MSVLAIIILGLVIPPLPVTPSAEAIAPDLPAMPIVQDIHVPAVPSVVQPNVPAAPSWAIPSLQLDLTPLAPVQAPDLAPPVRPTPGAVDLSPSARPVLAHIDLTAATLPSQSERIERARQWADILRSAGVEALPAVEKYSPLGIELQLLMRADAWRTDADVRARLIDLIRHIHSL